MLSFSKGDKIKKSVTEKVGMMNLKSCVVRQRNSNPATKNFSFLLLVLTKILHEATRNVSILNNVSKMRSSSKNFLPHLNLQLGEKSQPFNQQKSIFFLPSSLLSFFVIHFLLNLLILYSSRQNWIRLNIKNVRTSSVALNSTASLWPFSLVLLLAFRG